MVAVGPVSDPPSWPIESLAGREREYRRVRRSKRCHGFAFIGGGRFTEPPAFGAAAWPTDLYISTRDGDLRPAPAWARILVGVPTVVAQSTAYLWARLRGRATQGQHFGAAH